jgi:RimJ/RimL family protein N-acetyltransferase
MSATIPGPAYRIQTERLVLRCWDPQDAPLLKAAIDANLEHLWDWMPWAREEPQDLQTKIGLMRRFRGDFDLGNDLVYGIFNLEESQVLGGTGFHKRVGKDALEIGYWIHVDYINRGLATETAGALTQVAFRVHAVKRVEIHCDSDNVRSAAVPRKLGFVHEATLRRRDLTPAGEPRDTMIWTLLDDEYPTSPAASATIQAFDAIGRRIL